MQPDALLPLAEVKRRHVLAVLDACGGSRTDAARVLDVDRKTLYRWLVGYGVNVRDAPPPVHVRVPIATSPARNDESSAPAPASPREPWPDASTQTAPPGSPSAPWPAVPTRQPHVGRR